MKVLKFFNSINLVILPLSWLAAFPNDRAAVPVEMCELSPVFPMQIRINTRLI
jgi:hypothetical protein